MANAGGYAGKVIRVDLTSRSSSEWRPDAGTLRKWLGGDGLGAKILYDEVSPGASWSDPENCLILATGPLAGTRAQGTGTFSVITKHCVTNGASTSQANGFFGAFMKFSGFDAVVICGRANNWVYLYLHDGVVEFREATHLLGKDTVETERLIKKELGKTEAQLSVYAVGPAGENLVKISGIVGDGGHIVGRNGAIMGAKRLKAFAAARGEGRIHVEDEDTILSVSKELFEALKQDPVGRRHYLWGTGAIFSPYEAQGALPIKNLTGSEGFAAYTEFMAESFRSRVQVLKPKRCWHCRLNHLHTIRLTDGPYAGLEMEEPEYEQLAMFGPQIGNNDYRSAMMLGNLADRLGLDCEESGRGIGLLMECYEKGILSRHDIDGLDMTWGNVESSRALLYKIASRDGIGDILAEGTMSAAHRIGGEAVKFGMYTMKGLTQRGSDPRVGTMLFFDVCTSSTGHNECLSGVPEHGAPAVSDTFSPVEVPKVTARRKGRAPFVDSVGICFLASNGQIDRICQMISAATGWDFDAEEATVVGKRIVNLLRVYNIRCGHTADMDAPSPRLAEPVSRGPHKGKGIGPHFAEMRSRFYDAMGWTPDTGWPLPDTLAKYGLEEIIPDLWGKR